MGVWKNRLDHSVAYLGRIVRHMLPYAGWLWTYWKLLGVGSSTYPPIHNEKVSYTSPLRVPLPSDTPAGISADISADISAGIPAVTRTQVGSICVSKGCLPAGILASFLERIFLFSKRPSLIHPWLRFHSSTYPPRRQSYKGQHSMRHR